jgi:type I site-specific restriction-modification system R (restriction) subunit
MPGFDNSLLSDRRNIVVIADEAHRSQYDFIDGFAKHMRDALPKASFIGFTGTPIESGEPTLKNIARELVSHVRKSVTIDWTLREAAQAQIRVLVRRILRKYGYPPDKLLPSSDLRPPSPIRWAKVMQTVLEQAKLLCAEWAGD